MDSYIWYWLDPNLQCGGRGLLRAFGVFQEKEYPELSHGVCKISNQRRLTELSNFYVRGMQRTSIKILSPYTRPWPWSNKRKLDMHFNPIGHNWHENILDKGKNKNRPSICLLTICEHCSFISKHNSWAC